MVAGWLAERMGDWMYVMPGLLDVHIFAMSQRVQCQEGLPDVLFILGQFLSDVPFLVCV